MVNWFLPKYKEQSVDMFISSTSVTGTTWYLLRKIIVLIYHSQNTEKLPQNRS